ncbi:hypothetical protein [Jeotgalibacillus proteolyticus]|uniref:Lipoprotein n=1 Tax=Jeotgalibacillus proteolyticus TaxID=2082395 RepID=A0A2S5G7I9_9BACL|nr:hypothetical protein [Jeotgalibacillus proteolyticus]PPA68957.1 hypothetical protein C4B60_18785 [Jeotgalibacillus proteolyticus]
MVKLAKIFNSTGLLLLLVFLLTGCTGSPENEASATETTEDASEENNQADEKEAKTKTGTDTESEESISGDSSEAVSQETTNSDKDTPSESSEENLLSAYSTHEIEYARVWLQLGPNLEIDELTIRPIPAGTLLNPDDETSEKYPEDVIQLSGTRLVDGSVTYSSNGNGTINVYHVPLRWDGNYPAGEQFYIDLISNTELVSVDTGDNKQIVNLIKKIN